MATELCHPKALARGLPGNFRVNFAPVGQTLYRRSFVAWGSLPTERSIGGVGSRSAKAIN